MKRNSVIGQPSRISELTVGQILAITVPIASVLSSIAWSISVYFIVRERSRAQEQIDLAHVELDAMRHIYERDGEELVERV